jgi:TRAP-type C4-dicarboxylate transport system permease small subunit
VPTIRKLDGMLAAIVGALALVAGWGLLALTLLICVEVLGRKLLGIATQGADEIGGYVLAIVSTIGFSYGLYRKAHIRIDMVVRHLPLVCRALADVAALLTLNVFVWVLAWRAVLVAGDSWRYHAVAPTPLYTPLIIPQGLWMLAMLIFGLVALIQLTRALARIARGEWHEASLEFGVRELEEEVAEEVDLAAKRSRRESI